MPDGYINAASVMQTSNTYIVYRNFLDNDFCEYISSVYIEQFTFTPRGTWNAYTVNDGPIYKKICQNFSPIIPDSYTVSWINLTVYNPGDHLRVHCDEKSSLTIISELSDDYTGGRFIVDKDTFLSLNKTDVVTFNGSKVLHGVEKVETGVRLSLNLWTHPISYNI